MALFQEAKGRHCKRPDTVVTGECFFIQVNLLSFLESLNLTLHLISLALWIGGIAFFLFVFAPAVHALSPAEGIKVLERGRQSLQTLSWIAINLLVVTGVLNFLFRAIAGGFDLGQGYYSILAIKLLLFLAMLFHHSIQSFKYGPQLAALAAQSTGEIQSWPEPLLAHWKKWFMLLKINVTLGPIVMLLGLGLRWS